MNRPPSNAYNLAVNPIEPDLLLCACGAAYDAGDNYCRACGLPLRHDVPAVRESYPAAVWQPRVPPAVVRAAGVLAASTLAEYLARRLVNRALSPVRALVPGRPRAVQKSNHDEPAEIFSETLVVRRFHIRGR